MALRIAVPNFPLEHETPASPLTLLDQQERRVKLETYLSLDPAIRFLIALALVAAISLLYLVQTSSVTELNYDVQRQTAEHTKLIHEQQALQLDIARAQALPQLAQMARTQLKMVPVGDQYRYLNVPPETGAPARVPPAGGTP